ncbi:MAG: SurA N-terminal domain-containing protein [Bacteroidales bacterium]|nr:SurA N-terminal domain-containing protein [Bacteroidales bacterium]MCF8386664.1 SurA N-terminal domain-containing protein [Bacteroidales bacterium]MCF8399288.1 SurA N-terminal domain-containing protein [Bacteroidales bacterium]
MAVIGNIRKHSGLIVIVVGIALAAFVLGDFVKSGPSRSNVMGEVNGEEITYQEFSRELEENIQIEKQNKQKESLTAKEEYGIRHRTWDQMLYEIIMGEEFDKLGLDVSAEELFELVQGQNPHQFILQSFTDPNTGQFNRQRVLQYLQNLNQMGPEAMNRWINFEQAIKKDQIQEKYNALVSKGYYIPEAFKEKLYKQQETEAIIRLIGKRFFDVSDSLVSFTEQEVKEYYEENKYKYEQDASVDFDYVVFEVLPSETDHQNVKQEVAELYEELKVTDNVPMFVNAVSDKRYDSTWYKEGELPVMMDSIMMNAEIGTTVEPYMQDGAYQMGRLMDIEYRPDSMAASHILIAYQGAFRAPQEITRSRDEAQRLADSLFNVIQSNPAKLEQIAPEVSDDPSVKQNDGNLGMFADQTMVSAFNEAVVDGRVGEVKLVETPFGFHVIHILDKQEPVKKVRVAIVERTIDPSNKTVQKIYTEASAFAGENTDIADFEEAAAEEGMTIRSAPSIAKMTNNVPGVEHPRPIIRWAFDEKVNVGEVSPVFDMNDRYIVAVLKERRKEGVKSLEDVRDMIEGFLIREKKGEYLKEQMEQLEGNIYQMANDLGVEVDTLTVAFGSANLSGYGREAGVIGKIFTLEPGILSDPIVGNSGVYRVVLDEVLEAPGTENYDPYIRQVLVNFIRRIDNNSVYRALEEEANITDNRITYY